MKSKIINKEEAIKKIEDYNLNPYYNIWHYSFNYELLKEPFIYFNISSEIKILKTGVYNDFSPLPIFVSSDYQIKGHEYNKLNGIFNRENRENRHLFWFIKILEFNEFLKIKTETSSNYKKHFPTSYTYSRIKQKIKNDIKFLPFIGNELFFIENYNILREEFFHNGETILALFDDNNPRLNNNWKKIVYLEVEKKIVCIALIVDDYKSISLINIATLKNSLSYGVFLCTEILKYCSDNNYYSFDAGVSGFAGMYKEKIFINSFEVYKTKISFINLVKIKILKILKK